MKHERAPNRRPIALLVAGLVAAFVAAAADPLGAQGWSRYRQDQGWPPRRRQEMPPNQLPHQSLPHQLPQSRAHGAPLYAVVALGEQRITVYDAAGKMLQAPISTGSAGYETPAGIFSIVQKKEEHESNLYEDGRMPFMQRITWTGIALHAGQLPGHPASHGCVRMPLDFAQRLFALTDLGMRVVIVREDIAPAEIAHPALLRSNDAGAPKHLAAVKSQASAKAAEAVASAKRAAELGRAAAKKAAEAGMAAKAQRGAEGELARARERLDAAERVAQSMPPPDSGSAAALAVQKRARAAQQRLEKARAAILDIEKRLEAAKAQAQAKADAAKRALEDAKGADGARDAAAEAAEKAKRKGEPVSLFISRKTQRYYIRQGFEPVHEGPIAIRDPERPIGSYVFTALANSGAEVRWSVVSLYRSEAAAQAPPPVAVRHRGAPAASAAPADVAGAKAALDRLVIPPEALEQVPDMVLPGSSVIVSDEGPSIETGKDTDFVVVMSGEPQGALKVRKREPIDRWGDDDFFRSPFGGSSNRSNYKGFPFFR